MLDSSFRLDFDACRTVLERRLAERTPGRVQLLTGPRQVGKTTLLLQLAEGFGPRAIYAAADAPEAALPGFWERTIARAERVASQHGKAFVFLDEAHLLHDWAARLKGAWDAFRRRRIPVHVVATGSSALRLATGSRESLAGRFERLTLTHWSAASLARAFGLEPRKAAEQVVLRGSYPGAVPLLADAGRWAAYVRDAILEPAIGRDLLALTAVRRPALLRQVFAVAAASPARVVSLQKIQGQLQDAGAIETVAHYLALLEEAFLVAGLQKYSAGVARRRAAPPKLVTLNNALLAVTSASAPVDPRGDAALFGAWVENACLAHAWNAGQAVSYWREEPLEVDGVLEGSWGNWVVEVKTGELRTGDLTGLLEFARRHPAFQPLVVCSPGEVARARRSGLSAVAWQDFLLLQGPPDV